MYRLGLSRKRIAELVPAEPASVGYHLVIARRQDPGLEAAHLTAAGSKRSPLPPICIPRRSRVFNNIRTVGRPTFSSSGTCSMVKNLGRFGASISLIGQP